MGPSATQSDLDTGLAGVIDGLRELRRTNGVTQGVASAMEGAEICLSEALARVRSGEVVDKGEQ